MIRELAPNVTSFGGIIALADGVPSSILATNTAIERWLLLYSVGNTTCPISLRTVIGNIELCRIYAPTQTVYMPVERLLPNADNGLALVAHGAASGSVSYTIVYAPDALRIVSGKLRSEQFFVVP